MPFKFKKPRAEERIRTVNRLEPETAQEYLGGTVQGMKASDIEERFAKSLYKKKEPFVFQKSFFAGMNIPGEVRLDFLLTGSVIQPVQVDGEFAHKTAAQKGRDKLNDIRLDGRLRGMGALPVVRIDGELLQTQEESDRELEKVLSGY